MTDEPQQLLRNSEPERWDYYEITFSLADGLGIDYAIALMEQLEGDGGVTGAGLSAGNHGSVRIKAPAAEHVALPPVDEFDRLALARLRTENERLTKRRDTDNELAWQRYLERGRQLEAALERIDKLERLLSEVSDAARAAINHVPHRSPVSRQLYAAIDFNPPRDWVNNDA